MTDKPSPSPSPSPETARPACVSGGRYEVSYFAGKHGLSMKDAQRIINTHGPDRDSADRAAQRLKQ